MFANLNKHDIASCGFNLHFPDYQLGYTFFGVFIGYLNILFSEAPIQIFHPRFHCVTLLFLSDSWDFSRLYASKCLVSYMCVTARFSHSVAGLSNLLISFDEYKF